MQTNEKNNNAALNSNADVFVIGQEYTFVLESEEIDPKSNRSFFNVICTVNGKSCRFYPRTQKFANLNFGESIKLTVTGKNAKGSLRLEEPQALLYKDELPLLPAAADMQGIRESETVEFKSSMVFTGDGQNNIEKQLDFEIIQQLAGFMNHAGGSLYLGYRSNGMVRGIDEDLIYLNSSLYDVTQCYPTNLDGIELKIRNSITKNLGVMANTLVTVNFFRAEGDRLVCRIDVRPSLIRPVYYRETMLFTRVGNMTVQLKGDEITLFFKRLLSAEAARPFTGGKEEKKSVNSYCFSWTRNGEIFYSDAPSGEPDVIFNIPFTKEEYFSEKTRLIFCYADGAVNVLKPKEIVSGKLKTERKKYKNGFCQRSPLVAILKANENDLLLLSGSCRETQISVGCFTPNKGVCTHSSGSKVAGFKVTSARIVSQMQNKAA